MINISKIMLLFLCECRVVDEFAIIRNVYNFSKLQNVRFRK